MPQLLSLCSSTRESECLKTQSMRALESAHSCRAHPLWSPSAPATGMPTGLKMSPMPQSRPHAVRAVTVSQCKKIKVKVRTSWEDAQLEDWTVTGTDEVLLKGKFHNSSFLFITDRKKWMMDQYFKISVLEELWIDTKLTFIFACSINSKHSGK